MLKTDGGRELMLDLAEATYLADGDGLLLEDGGVVLVRAAAEDLMEIRAAGCCCAGAHRLAPRQPAHAGADHGTMRS